MPQRHHQRGNAGVFWPGGSYGDSGLYANDGGPAAEAPGSPAAYEIPWDWAHRLPPAVLPSDHPYVPGCHNEIVTVQGRSGQDQTVNVTRCF